MKIAIVGLGLIGGSLAKTIKKHTNHHVIGINRSMEVLRFAKSVGAIDEIGSESALNSADITIVCLYPDAVVDFVLSNKNNFKKNSIVVDAAGVKEKICTPLAAAKLPFTFIGGHPMAGREVSGFENSLDDMFDNASFILTPVNQCADELERLKSFINEMHFARIVVTTPKQHDEIIAYTSQIAHVLACAYVLSPRAKQHFGFSAGSFRDVSRVAKINEELWAQLFLDNSETLCEEIETLIENLQMLKQLIGNDELDELKAVLKQGRQVKEEIDKAAAAKEHCE